jgi:hypothetical protein
MNSPLLHYQARKSALEGELGKLARLSMGISLGRVASFVVGAAALGAHLFFHAPFTLAGGLVALVVFVGLVVWHARVVREEDRTKAALLFCERGNLRLASDAGALPQRGKTILDPPPYAGDLDLLGEASLLSLLDAMETDLSEERLARWLSSPSAPAEARLRQASAGELSKQPELLEELFVRSRPAAEKSPDLPAFVAFCSEPEEGAAALGLRIAAFVLPLITLPMLFFPGSLGVRPDAWLVPGVVQGLIALRVGMKTQKPLTMAAKGARALGAYAELLARLAKTKPTSERLRTLFASLEEGDSSAVRGLTRLERLAGWIEARDSGLFRVFIAPLVLYDVHVHFALMRWRRAHGKRVAGWVEALSELLALSGLGTFAFDHPDFVFPTIHEGPSRFAAEALGHPLLPLDRRVPNDVALDGAGTALLVTGSNMSGKSTLLRSMGMAAVMALAGAPVCARRLDVSVLTVRTSIRVSDSLKSGVSHFYAELLALKRVVVDSRKLPVFFLLDEILHGTNSRERQIGAKSVIKDLLAHGAMGAVSTHDLGLAELSEEMPEKVRPVHFIEQAEGDKMTFDYRLRMGFLTSGNALRLMKQMGLPVEE